MQILHQLGDLFLGSVPTIIILLLFYAFMRWAFFAPMQRVLSERRARIEGARAEAAAAEAEAKHDLDAYHEALRKARIEIHARQGASRQAVLAERARLLSAMRTRAQEEVAAAKKRMAADFQAARAEIERQSDDLAITIARSLLEPAGPRPADGAALR